MSQGFLAADWPAPGGIVAGTTLHDSHYQLPLEPKLLNQVHGARAVRWGSAVFEDGAPDADAITSDQPGSICTVRTADCLPILFCATDGSEVAAAHGGWRGLAAGIIEATLEQLSTPPGRLLVWLGPAISQPAFEVGGEVREAFCDTDAEAEVAFAANDRGRWQADLYLLARQRLGRAGVTSIYGGGFCTHDDAARFYSYRRDGETGRLLSFVHKP